MTGYEVSLEVDASIAEAFAEWLHRHVDEMLALPGFLSAELFAVDEPRTAPDRRGFCVVYRLRDRAALECYLAEHAPRMRGEGLARFGGRFTATRRILSVLRLSAPAPAP